MVVPGSPTHVHLIGIGGAGLSAIALLLLQSGYTVSGSDRQLSPLAKSVEAAGARLYAGHRAEHVSGADLVVRSSAVPDDNVEVQAARQAGIPVYKRADFLGQLMAGRQGIAIAGTHGKTTTTAMIAWMLTALGQDPSFIIGGVSANLGANARAGQGPAFVIEADEYDRMFLGLSPQIVVVTNVEHDHPDCFPTPQDFYRAFYDFTGRIQPGGILLACCDDPGAARLLQEADLPGRQTLSYGLAHTKSGLPQPTYAASDLHPNESGGFTFAMHAPQAPEPLTVTLQTPGEHNVRNALAALGVAAAVGLPLVEAAAALGEFRGTARRFELRGEVGGVTVIDDYAHHPTEIRATLAAARVRYTGRQLWAVWQPHTYSRTRTLFADFAAAFTEADYVVVTGVYAARETIPPDFSARQLATAIAQSATPSGEVHFIPDLVNVTAFLLSRLSAGDVLLVLSAGDADQVSAQVLAALSKERSDFHAGR
jgi:UDP-N-acetylmuramate--alanine ligase